MQTPAPTSSGDGPASARIDAPVALPVLGGILALAAALRIRGGWNDLWLDEIWSLELAREVRTPLDVFVRFHHEINHYLNTLWLWLAGDAADTLLYRVPSLIAGIGALAIAARIAWRRGPAAVYFTTVVVSFSYVLVLYASEVRGYATLVFFSFSCFLLIGHYLRRDGWKVGVGFSFCAVLGLLSHLLFVSVLLSALTWSICWSVWQLRERRLSLREAAARIALCYGAPTLCLAALYVVDIRHVVVGGGGVSGSLIAGYGTALGWALGAPTTAAAQLLGCILAVAILDAGLRLVRRRDPGEALFFLCVIVVFPVLLVIVRDTPIVYTRHFLLPIAFLLLLFGFVLADLWERGRLRRWAAAGLLGAYLVANAAHLRELFLHGRGQNGDAIRFMLERSAPGPIAIGADNDYRIERVVAFFAARLGASARIVYEPRGTWQGVGPQWLIVNRDSFELPVSRGDEIHDEAGRRFALVASFPAAPLAGLHWFLYQNRAR